MSNSAIQYGGILQLPADYSSLSEMIMYIASCCPNLGMTYIDASGNESFTNYTKLISQSLKVLTGLQRQGLQKGDSCIIEINNPEQFYTVFWACIFGGIVVAAVSQPTSWKFDSDKIKKLLNIWNILKKPVILIAEKYKKNYICLQENAEFSGLRCFSTEELMSEQEAIPISLKSDSVAVIQFSSGSTGLPKGVQLTHMNILSNIFSISSHFALTPDDVAFTWLPHTHDLGLFCQYLTSVIAKCPIIIFSPATFVRSPYLFLKKISDHQGTWFASPNFGFDWMIKKISEVQCKKLDLSTVRFIINGAEPISRSVVNKFMEKFSQYGLKTNSMCPAYGMAEATVGITCSPIGQKPKIKVISRFDLLNSNASIAHAENINNDDKVYFFHEGTPFKGTSIRIADFEGNTLLENQIGEIQVKSLSITSGYYNNEKATAKAFDKDGWFRTGDLGLLVDGSLVVTGRIKDIIFVNGQNYFSHDLEEVVCSQGNIQRGDLVFVGLFDAILQKEILIAFIKHKLDIYSQVSSTKNINEFLLKRQFIMDTIQSSLGITVTQVIPVASVPKTTSGKLQRFYLRQNYERGDYNNLIEKIQKTIVKHQLIFENKTTPSHVQQNKQDKSLEQSIRSIWSEILGISIEHIHIDDTFFSLGGTSVKAFQMLNAMESQLQRVIDTDVLIVCKTIRQIVDYLESNPTQITKKVLSKNQGTNFAVAITGMSLRLPAANNQQEFWDNLCNKKDCIDKVSAKRQALSDELDWNDWIGELENIDYFDHDFFDISPEEASFMDPQQRLALEVAYEALEDAGTIPGTEEGERHIGVYSGLSANTYYQLLIKYLKKQGHEAVNPLALVGNLCNMIAAKIARVNNFTGPAINIDTACSSFLVTLHHAVMAIRQKHIQGAVVVGANILVTSDVHALSRQAGILSSTQHAKVFDSNADGTVLGEGIVVFYIEPLENALKNGKQIYGVIRGTAMNNDGNSFATMAPNPKGQHKVILATYQDAGLNPHDISYIEAHGTGTSIGDPVEINVLRQIFLGCKHTVGLGSVKTNIGHLLAASGAASLAKLLLCLKHKTFVPNLHLERLNPTLKLDQSPFYVLTETTRWESHDGKSRKAGISAFGLGGTNAHVLIEERPKSSCSQQPDQLYHLLSISAKSKNSLEKMKTQLQAVIKNTYNLNINDLCFTRNRFRKHYDYRAIFLIDKNKNIKYCLDSEEMKKPDAEPLSFLIYKISALLCQYKAENSNAKSIYLPLCFLMGQLYVLGIDLDWQVFYPTGNLIYLPPYPFEQNKFWINQNN